MAYKDAQAIAMALKDAAHASGRDVNRAISSFYFHRFLCRIFDSGHQEFVLKGGLALLARTVDARATRDIDLLTSGQTLEEAFALLQRLASVDLGDHLTYEFLEAEHIRTADDYRDGLSIKVKPTLGDKARPPFTIDLVVDQIPLNDIEQMHPADRLILQGLSDVPFNIYPLENTLADKFCAIHEMHGDRESTRVKDLVDVAIMATHCSVDGRKLAQRLRREASARSLLLPLTFNIPSSWYRLREPQYMKLAKGTGLTPDLRHLQAAEKLAQELYNPVLADEDFQQQWKPASRSWHAEGPEEAIGIS